MPAPSSRRRHAGRRRETVAVRRARRIAALVALAAVALVTLLLTAFGSGRPAAAVAPVPAPAGRLVPVGPPRPQVIAQLGTLLISMPIPQSRVTAIGYHGADQNGLALVPRGTQANQGLLRRLLHRLGGGAGAACGTTRSPADRARRRASSTSARPPGRTSTRRSTGS